MDIIEQLNQTLNETKTYKSKKRKVFKILEDNNILFCNNPCIKCIKEQYSHGKNYSYIIFLKENIPYLLEIDYLRDHQCHLIEIENLINEILYNHSFYSSYLRNKNDNDNVSKYIKYLETDLILLRIIGEV